MQLYYLRKTFLKTFLGNIDSYYLQLLTLRELDICGKKCEGMYGIQITFPLKQLHSKAAHEEINSYLIKTRSLHYYSRCCLK